MKHRNIIDYYQDDWWADAACLGTEPGMMFPMNEEQQRFVASTVCGQCAVRAECLEFALVTKQEHGVWGGDTESGRRHLLKISKAQKQA
ncbi:WhiB family transcriptional regulator [Candidatus Saccharibacteria bacterium]|nr:WhiB family transcriptional regulator [Candidatus Saccharibacteria bacterium]